jgi:hypothetical protein
MLSLLVLVCLYVFSLNLVLCSTFTLAWLINTGTSNVYFDMWLSCLCIVFYFRGVSLIYMYKLVDIILY